VWKVVVIVIFSGRCHHRRGGFSRYRISYLGIVVAFVKILDKPLNDLWLVLGEVGFGLCCLLLDASTIAPSSHDELQITHLISSEPFRALEEL